MISRESIVNKDARIPSIFIDNQFSIIDELSGTKVRFYRRDLFKFQRATISSE